MLEETAITGTKIIQTRIAIAVVDKAILRTFTMTCKGPTALFALTGELVILELAEPSLLFAV